MECFVCIHCHFYQPPRENAWLEAVESQDSAAPYHDWNERITAECYLPNGASRILDPQGRITDIVNNYARISFNFGPTLLSWMEERAPEAYQQVLGADRESQIRFSGHGSARPRLTTTSSCRSPTRVTNIRKSNGASLIFNTGLDPTQKGCGSRKPPLTVRHWTFWHRWGSSSQSSHRTRRENCEWLQIRHGSI